MLRIVVLLGVAASMMMLLKPVMVLGQAVNGKVIGNVSDSTGAVIPNVEITVTNDDTGARLVTNSSDSGVYVFDSLSSGMYTLTAKASGFADYTVTNIRVSVGQVGRIDLVLKVGNVSERVNVAAVAPMVESDRAQVSMVVTNEQMQQLPVNGHTEMNAFLRLAPGIFTPWGSSTYPFADQTSGFYAGWSETIDGAPTNATPGGWAGLNSAPPWDSMEEFRVVTNNASAEYFLGMSQITMVSKSGTNQFHGTLSEFNRNRAYAARYVLNHDTNTPFNRNEFGATIGGPIIKDKLFFLGSFEHTIVRASSPLVAAQPTAAMKQGDFSNLLATGTTIIDPLTGEPFPNNKIPADRISPVSSALMAFLANPNSAGVTAAGTGTNYFGVSRNRESDPRYNGRIDYHPTSNDFIFGAYTQSRQTSSNNGGPGDLYGGYNADWGNFKQARFGWTRIFSPSTTGDTRVSFTRNSFNSLPTTNLGFDIGSLLPALNDQCCTTLTGGLKSTPGRPQGGVPVLSINGYTGISDGPWNGDQEDRLYFSQNLTKVHGKHTLKAGGYYWHVRYYWGGMYSNGRGSFDFTGRYTGDSFADFLLGDANHSQRASAYQFGDLADNFFGGFVHDDWHATDRLTVNLGLRYDVQTPVHEVNGNQAVYLPELNSLVTFSGTSQFPRDAVPRLLESYPIITSVDAGLGTTTKTYKTSYLSDTLSPRLGLAYRLTADGKTVLRAGAGIYRKYLPLNWMGLNYVLNAPFSLVEDFYSPTTNSPYVTFSNPFPGVGDIPSAPSVFSFARQFPRPYATQWTVSFDREILRQTSLRLTYAGSKLTHGQWFTDINSPRVPGPGTLQSLRPYQPWGTVNYFLNGWDANKNQLQVELLRRAGNSTVQLEYTWTKAIDNFGFGLEAPLLINNRGNSDFVARHRAVLNWVTYLPLGRGQKFLSGIPKGLDYILGGWQFTGITELQSGIPFDVTYTSPLVGYPASGRANVVGDWTVSNPGEAQWFNPSAFAAPAPFTFGSLGRNSLFGPGYWNVNAGLMKNFKFHERLNLQFRSEWYNLFNHPNLGMPNSNISFPGAGQIVSFTEPRAIQFGLKLYF
jgi:hypothetical protein